MSGFARSKIRDGDVGMIRRYIIMLGALVVLLAVVLLLRPQANGVDILISLKEINQRIVPAALSCPDWSYPAGSTPLCQVEGPAGRANVEVIVSESGVDFANQQEAEQALAFVSG